MIVLAHLLASVLTFNNSFHFPSFRAECRNVSGQIEARAHTIKPTISGLRLKGTGSSAGDWTGTVQLEALKRISGDLEISFRIATDQGVVSARGRAETPPDPMLHHARKVTADLRVKVADPLNALTGTVTFSGFRRYARPPDWSFLHW